MLSSTTRTVCDALTALIGLPVLSTCSEVNGCLDLLRCRLDLVWFYVCYFFLPKCHSELGPVNVCGIVPGKKKTKFALKWPQYLAANPTSWNVAKIETFYTHSFCTHLCSQLKDAKWVWFAFQSKQKTGICINNCFFYACFCWSGNKHGSNWWQNSPFSIERKTSIPVNSIHAWPLLWPELLHASTARSECVWFFRKRPLGADYRSSTFLCPYLKQTKKYMTISGDWFWNTLVTERA